MRLVVESECWKHDALGGDKRVVKRSLGWCANRGRATRSALARTHTVFRPRAANQTNNNNDDDDDDDDDDDQHQQAAAASGLPALFGDICVGVALGPRALDVVPYSDALVLLGELGLCLHALEVGMHVELATLVSVGRRALALAFLGSLAPAALAYGVARLFWALPPAGAFAVGASLAPMSPAIALSVFHARGALNRPVTCAVFTCLPSGWRHIYTGQPVKKKSATSPGRSGSCCSPRRR